MRRLPILFAAAGLLAAGAAPALAQLPGIPYGPTPSGAGFSLSADYGNPDPGSAWGVMGGLGLTRLGLMAGVGTTEFGNDDVTTFGAAAGLTLLDIGPVGVGAQLGLSVYDPDDSSRLDWLPGVHGKANIMGFPIKPWAVVYDAVRDGAADEFRFTIGADWNILPMMGVHAGYDWGDINDTWGVGAHFKFGGS